jgi:putative aldouronate transport system permease protein
MSSLPYEIVDSGKIDGAGDFSIYRRLIMPISTPVIATIGLFTALMFWNDWYHSMLFINDEQKYSLQYLLYKLINDARMLRIIAAESGEYIETGPIESMKMAMTLIVTGPILLLYPFVQRYFVKGLTIGAVKG